MSPGNNKQNGPARARAAMLEAIRTQIRTNDPPETRETAERLKSEGYSEEETLKYIACALVGELVGVLKNESTYNHARYVANLKRLPQLPWENDEGTVKPDPDAR